MSNQQRIIRGTLDYDYNPVELSMGYNIPVSINIVIFPALQATIDACFNNKAVGLQDEVDEHIQMLFEL